MPPALARQLDETLHVALTHVRAGNMGTAEGLLQALSLQAHAAGQQEVAERAFVNAISVRLEIEGSEIPVQSLRTILSRSGEPFVRYLAAQALSRHYRRVEKPRHATFYARIAAGTAPDDRRGPSRHQLGSQSVVAEALSHLEAGAEAWLPELAPIELSWSAIGYARSLLGRRRMTHRYLELASRRSVAFPVYHCGIHLNVGYAFLELGEVEEAHAHAVQALASHLGACAHEHKSALYLLGESASQLGRDEEAHLYFSALCRAHYPQVELADLLVAVRTSGLVNWLA